ncbi:MAG: MMPL family transporter, partial [Bacteroidia bacterium]
ALLNEIKPRIDSIFPLNTYTTVLTGHSRVFLKSQSYLQQNLIESLIIEIILIALVGLLLFRSLSIIVLSKLPCLLPLLITAGIMGFADIAFKPSTILIFSIAFGISSDGTVYFLTRFRNEIKRGLKFHEAIRVSIYETGQSMVFTTIILFFGFIVFGFSSFGGTSALGILVSITLVMALLANLILLPCILISLQNRIKPIKEHITPNTIIDDEHH